jgi:ABC-type lipoprotein release transport system permease subunit
LDNGNIINYPQHLGERISYSIFDKDLNKTVVATELKIVGVFMDHSEVPSIPDPRMYVNPQNLEIIKETIDNVVSIIMVYIDGNYKNLPSLISKYSSFNLYPIFNFSFNYYSYETGIRQNQQLMDIISIALLTISFLLMNNFLIISINSKKKEIGILKSLGSSNIIIYKIFLVESLLIGIITLLITISFLPIIPSILNKILCPDESKVLTFFSFEPLSLLIIFCSTLFIPILSTLLPIKKIVNMRPIETIKNK